MSEDQDERGMKL